VLGVSAKANSDGQIVRIHVLQKSKETRLCETVKLVNLVH
jgi:hypothetical protein